MINNKTIFKFKIGDRVKMNHDIIKKIWDEVEIRFPDNNGDMPRWYSTEIYTVTNVRERLSGGDGNIVHLNKNLPFCDHCFIVDEYLLSIKEDRRNKLNNLKIKL